MPIHGVTKAITGGVAFAVGQTLDVSPRLKLGTLPVKLEVGATVFKEEGATSDDEVLVLRVRAVDLIVEV